MCAWYFVYHIVIALALSQTLLWSAPDVAPGKLLGVLAVAASTVVLTHGLDLATADINSLQCDPAGEVFLLLPHFTNCSKFFMCAHGKEVDFICPEPLIFDFVMQTCNWDWAAKCTLRTPVEDLVPEGSGDGSEGSGDLEGSGDNDLGLIGAEAAFAELDGLAVEGMVGPLSSSITGGLNSILNCIRPDSSARQVAYAGDCQRYWKCINGVAKTLYCSDGLFFNEKTEQCDFEANVKCDVQIIDELQGEFIEHKK